MSQSNHLGKEMDDDEIERHPINRLTFTNIILIEIRVHWGILSDTQQHHHVMLWIKCLLLIEDS